MFPLDEEEAAVQRQMLSDSAYEGASQRVIQMFGPEGARHKEIATSLDRLARLIEGDPEDAREAVRLVTGNGDFTTTLDVSGLAPHKVFRIQCDWEQFDRTRLTFHGMTEDGKLAVTLPGDLS